MNKTTVNSLKKHMAAIFLIKPGLIIFYISSIILSIMFITGITLMVTQNALCSYTQAIVFAYDLLHTSSRVAAIAAIFMTLAAALDVRYPDDKRK